MALIVEFICELPNGVHARPASHVETLCNTFSSQIEWHNLRTDRKGNAKSALALIGTDTLAGDNCQLLISGADEQEAHQRLSQWLRDEFPHCDAPLAEVKSDELEPLPVSLTNLNPQIIRARTVCSRRQVRRYVGSLEGRHPDVRMRREHRYLQGPDDRFERIVHHQLPCPHRQGSARQVRHHRRSDDHRSLDHRNAEDCRRSLDEGLARRPCRFGQHHSLVDRRCKGRRQGDSRAER